MLDEDQVAQDQKLEPQNPAIPPLPVSAQPLLQSQLQSINDTVAPIPTSVYKKHGFPISFKSLSLIILFLLMGSVFVISQLSSQKGSLDLRSRASKKEDKSLLKNGAFAQKLLGWKQRKKEKEATIVVINDQQTNAKAVKIVNTAGNDVAIYQDVKVKPDIYYTVRVEGKRTEDSDGLAILLLEEYNFVGGKPKFVKKNQVKKIFNTTSFQTKGAIVKTGKVILVEKGHGIEIIRKIYAGQSCNGSSSECGAGCPSDQKCKPKANSYVEELYECQPDSTCNSESSPSSSSQAQNCSVCRGIDSLCRINCINNRVGDCSICGAPLSTCYRDCISDNNGNQSDNVGQNLPPPPSGDTGGDTGDSGGSSGGDGSDSGDGGESGGSTPADKYVRISLVMSKKGTAYFKNVKLEPGKINSVPKISSTPPGIATRGAQLRYQVTASDPDGDTLVYGLGTVPCPFDNPKCKQEKPPIPKDAVVTQAGLFTFTPEASGTAKIQLWVSDGMKPMKQEFRLTIN